MRTRRKRPTEWSPAALARLSDEEVIRACATAVADRTVLKTGKLTIENRIRRGAPAGSIEAVLEEAARRQIPLETLAGQVVDEATAGRSFISNLMAPPSWRRYEIHAAHCLLSLLEHDGLKDADVQFDARRVGVITRESRQIDLLVRSSQPKPHEVAFEFKNYPDRRVPVGDVEAFASKIQDIAVPKGVLLTALGYERSASATAKHHGIVLFTFREIAAADLRRTQPEHADKVVDDGTYWLLDTLQERTLVFSGSLTRPARLVSS